MSEPRREPPSRASFAWRGPFEDPELSRLHAECFGHPVVEERWRERLEAHSLGWICARRDLELVGFVNVSWDGGAHAFLLDTLVAESARHVGIGTRLVEMAGQRAREAGCSWLHVDFEPHLRGFYTEACGFSETAAGVLRL